MFAHAAKPAALGLVSGISISRFAFFVAAPFLTVILNRKFGMPIAKIGALFTIAGLLGLSAAPLGGMLADRLGLYGLITGSAGIVALGYLSMMLFSFQLVFEAAILGSAFANGILEPLLRSVLSTIGFSLHFLASQANWALYANPDGAFDTFFPESSLFAALVQEMLAEPLAFYRHICGKGVKVWGVVAPKRVPELTNPQIFKALRG